MNILVYSGLELIGDGVMKLPFVRALRQRWPEAQITWLAGKGKTVYAGVLAPLVAHSIDAIIEDAGIGSRAGELLRRPLSPRRFDLVIDTQRRVLTTLILRRIRHDCFVSGAAEFLLSDRKPPRNYRRPERLIDQLMDLIAIAGDRPVQPDFTLDLGVEWRDWAARLLPAGPIYIGLAPGAGGVHKRWPRENFVALAQAEMAAGREIVLLLGPAEEEWREPLQAALPTARFPLQDCSVPEAIAASPLFTMALGERLAVAVANDSGTGHLIAASGCAMVSLFGPTRPEKFAPGARRLEVIAAQSYGSSEMAAIPVGAVRDAIARILSEL